MKRHVKCFSDQRLSKLYEKLEGQQDRFIGYPCNNDFDYSELFPFLGMSINNVGDPYAKSTFRLNTCDIEQEVINLFGRLTHAPMDNFWGYVTNGGTEGNMYGLFLGRELYPDGIVYYSEDTHYSVSKLMRVLNVKSIMLRSKEDGSLDLEDLRATLQINRHSPAIIVANIGTTMTGAVDDISGIKSILKDLAMTNYYIHADCALSGMILPFVDDPQPFDFAAGCHSLSISGHKFIGSPIPCGIVLALKGNVDRIARSVEYVGTLDTTITGSRNGITPLILWTAWQKKGHEGFRSVVNSCLNMAQKGVEMMQARGMNAWRHKNSVTVVFDKPHQNVIDRWSLAIEQERAHFITMPHVTEEMITRLIDEISDTKHQGEL